MVLVHTGDSPTIHLESIKGILRHYCQGLTARNVQIRSTKELTEKGIGWTSVEQPATEGSAIFLPPSFNEFDSSGDNFAQYKVLATHQAAHLEFGTFDFSFETSSSVFADTRSEILGRLGRNGEGLTDFHRFFDLFDDRRLASDIFMIVEDTRVDYLLKQEYRGIHNAYERAQSAALQKRPEIASLPLREALLEILVQLSIENWGLFSIPDGRADQASAAATILRQIRSRRATVEDSAEATIRLYNLLAKTKNISSTSRSPQNWDSSNQPGNPFEPFEDDLNGIVSDFLGQNTGGGQANKSRSYDGAEEPYESPRKVDYRGGIKPELVQTLRRLRQSASDSTEGRSAALSFEDLRTVFDKSVEIDSKDPSNSDQTESQTFAQNLIREMVNADDPPKRTDHNALSHVLYPSSGRSASLRRENSSFFYDEWDYLANTYRLRWCQLRQRSIDEGSANFYAKTVKDHAGLVASVKREFERLRTERFKKVRRLQDGDEFDFDSVIEAVVEKRIGVTPSDKLYWRKNKVERDVCVLFLLDMSASTYEYVSGGYRVEPSTQSESGGRAKCIIDVEKEGIVVLAEALEAIGDAYGIYGFSGHGKDSVEFYSIKEISEDMSAKIKRRIDSIAPAQETRMGTAIRHATAILNKQEHKTKLLLLLSDGRPQDHDYGAQHDHGIRAGSYSATGARAARSADHPYDYLMKEYAINDTRMALVEARQRNIVPFCLTIDKRGHDYLKDMCGDIGYEVLDDIITLPKRLPSLYKKLTT